MRQQGALKNIGWQKVNGVWYRKVGKSSWLMAEKQEGTLC